MISLRYLTVALLIAVVLPPCTRFQAGTLPDYVQGADDYWLGRQNLQNVKCGIELLRNAASRYPRDYEAWWRIARLESFLGRHTSGSQKRRALNDGINAGKKAVALQPTRVEGHFWLGANEGLLAEDGGLLEGLRLLDSIKREMETVVRLNADYEEGSGLRTLGRIYCRAPFFKGGDKQRAVELLQQCLQKYPDNSLTMLYLADSYMATGHRGEARALLQKILQLCPDPNYGPELADNKSQARELLQREFRASR